MPLHIGNPYKIIALREKRYETHYDIPSNRCLIVPVRDFGDEVLCDILWRDDDGEVRVLHNKMFVAENLVPLNPMLQENLYELWSERYKPDLERSRR